MTTALKTIELTEAAYTVVPSDKIDRTAGVIRGVKILGKRSNNAGGTREYTGKAIQEAAGRYEGLEVNLNHPRGSKSSVRDLREGWGVLRNTRAGEDGAYGDIHYLKSHPDTSWLLERIERGMQIGLSHNARGRCRNAGGREIIESVPIVFSADLVSRPATCKSLFESATTNNHKGKIMNASLVGLISKSVTKTLREMAIDPATDDIPPDANDNLNAAELVKAIREVLDRPSLADERRIEDIRDLLGVGPADQHVEESYSYSPPRMKRMPRLGQLRGVGSSTKKATRKKQMPRLVNARGR